MEVSTDGEQGVDAGDYQRCPGTGCIECPLRDIGRFARNYKLEPTPGVRSRKQEKYTLTIYPKSGEEQQIPVRMPHWNPLSGEGGRGNCFAFATHRDYQTPAGTRTHEEVFGSMSPVLRPHDCTEENFEEAMRREGALFLGRDGDDFLDLDALDVVPGREYYIVAAFLTPGEEFHFWGLWNNGWYMVSSKISAVVVDLGWQSKAENLCPRTGVWAQMKAKNAKYNKKMGGIYLFPTRSTGIDWLPSHTQAEEMLLASELRAKILAERDQESELGAKILAERDQKEKAIRRESGGPVPWLLGLA